MFNAVDGIFGDCLARLKGYCAPGPQDDPVLRAYVGQGRDIAEEMVGAWDRKREMMEKGWLSIINADDFLPQARKQIEDNTVFYCAVHILKGAAEMKLFDLEKRGTFLLDKKIDEKQRVYSRSSWMSTRKVNPRAAAKDTDLFDRAWKALGYQLSAFVPVYRLHPPFMAVGERILVVGDQSILPIFENYCDDDWNGITFISDAAELALELQTPYDRIMLVLCPMARRDLIDRYAIDEAKLL